MAGTDAIVDILQDPGGDRGIDNSLVPNTSGDGGLAYRQRIESYGASCASVEHLASQTLPAAGAFTSQAGAVVPTGSTVITWVFSYTRGADGGYLLIRPKWGDGVNLWDSVTVQKTFTTVNGRARRRLFLEELDGPRPVDASLIRFGVSVQVDRGATVAAVHVAEGGVMGAPGTVAVAMLAGTL